jgi:hypothetical protein
MASVKPERQYFWRGAPGTHPPFEAQTLTDTGFAGAIPMCRHAPNFFYICRHYFQQQAAEEIRKCGHHGNRAVICRKESQQLRREGFAVTAVGAHGRYN